MLVGASQCGKTTAGTHLVARLQQFTVVDYAHRGAWEKTGAVITEDPDAVLYQARTIFRPPRGAVLHPAKDYSDPWSRYLHNVRQVKRSPIIHDEGRRTMRPNPHPFVGEMVDHGMGEGISTWVFTQGIFGIYGPMVEFTPVWLFFRVDSASQRGLIDANLGVQLGDRLGGLGWGQFFAWQHGWTGPTGPHDMSELHSHRDGWGIAPPLPDQPSDLVAADETPPATQLDPATFSG